MFFYREPEESKGKQEEDGAVENYADYSTAALGGTDQWPNQITDSQWNDEGIAPAIPAVPGVTWTPDAGEIILLHHVLITLAKKKSILLCRNHSC